jgi:hypothetical protein
MAPVQGDSVRYQIHVEVPRRYLHYGGSNPYPPPLPHWAVDLA